MTDMDQPFALQIPERRHPNDDGSPDPFFTGWRMGWRAGWIAGWEADPQATPPAPAPSGERLTGYVVVDIGCLECGEPSYLVGVVADRDAAVAAGAQVVLDSSTDALSVTWGGQGIVVAFRLNGDWRSPNV